MVICVKLLTKKAEEAQKKEREKEREDELEDFKEVLEDTNKKYINELTLITKENKKEIENLKRDHSRDVSKKNALHYKELNKLKKDMQEDASRKIQQTLIEEREFFKREEKEDISVGRDYSYLYETDADFMQKIISLDNKQLDALLEKREIQNKDSVKKWINRIKEGDTGWTVLGMGTILDINRYQSLNDLWDLQDAAYNKTRTDPIARSAVNNLQFFTIGKGIKFEAADQKVQDVLRNFWTLNNMDIKQKEMVRSTFIEGEYFILYFINKTTGRVKVRRIRPKEIHSIETHPDDIETILAYKRVRAGLDEMHYADVDYFVQKEEDGIDVEISKVDKNLEDDKLIQFIKYSWSPDEVRGRVPMDCVMKTLKYYQDWLLDRVRLNHERSKVVWIKKIRGRGTETTVERTRTPKGGVMLRETDRVSYRIESAQIRADDVEKDGLSILYSIGSGFGMPIHVLNQRASEEVYASIKKADTPFSQSITDNQDFWSANFDKMFRVVIRSAREAGTLPEKIKVPKFKQDKVIEAMHRINEMVIDEKDVEEIVKETKPILEGKQTQISIPVEEVPINKIFPEAVKENLLEQAKVLQIHSALEIASNQTIAEKAGYSWKEELFRMKNENSNKTTEEKNDDNSNTNKE